MTFFPLLVPLKNTCADMLLSPYTCWSISSVFDRGFPSKTKRFIFMRCSVTFGRSSVLIAEWRKIRGDVKKDNGYRKLRLQLCTSKISCYIIIKSASSSIFHSFYCTASSFTFQNRIIYIYIYIYIFVCVRISVYIYIYIYRRIFTHTREHTITHAKIYIYIYIYIPLPPRVWVL